MKAGKYTISRSRKPVTEWMPGGYSLQSTVKIVDLKSKCFYGNEAEMSRLFAEGMELRDAQWQGLIEHAKHALNKLALKDYRQAPFIQWALVSLDYAVRFANRDAADRCSEYLKLTSVALGYTKQIADSSFHKGRPGKNSKQVKLENRALDKATNQLKAALRRNRQYEIDRNPINLYHARISLRRAVLELIATDKNFNL